MKIKLDENIGRRGQELLRSAGHDVATVHEQNMGGATNETLYQVCGREGRVLITLDHDFSHVLRFPPEKVAGIVVLELPPNAGLNALLKRLDDFIKLSALRPVAGELWIVEPGRVRVHQREDIGERS